MKIYKNELVVTRGEAWTYDVKLVNPDGSPFVISSQLQDPYFVFTVATGKYAEYGRYVHHYWCKFVSAASDEGGLRSYFITKPIQLTDWNTSPIDTPEIVRIYDEARKIDTHVDWTNLAVYFVELSDGTKEYKYYDASDKSFNDYECAFRIAFMSQDTMEWVEQEYNISLKLVDGVEIHIDELNETFVPIVSSNFMQVFDIPSSLRVQSNLSYMEGIDDGN